MTKSNARKTYRKGADYERKLVKEAREQGKLAFRSAGSHSPIDVCIVDVETGVIQLIQAKTYDTTLSDGSENAEERRFKEEWVPYNGHYYVSFEFC